MIKNWLIAQNLDEPLINEYLLLTNLCMSQSTFLFQDKIYQQTEGTAMGNPLSCFLANIFMSNFEMKAKNTLSYFPRLWIRYVDDVFAIFDKNQDLFKFVSELNSYYPSIRFTFEVEQNNSLPFLDILVTKQNNSGKIEFDIYRKPTSNDRFIPRESYHHPSQKRAVFHSLIHRLLHTPLSAEKYSKEVNKIKQIALFNGYLPDMID